MFDLTAALPVLKEYYGDKGVPSAVYKETPAFGSIKKKKITGEYIAWPVQYGRAANRSRTGTTALTRPNAPAFVRFNVPTVEDYDSISVSKKALAECKDEGAFLDLLTNAIESVAGNLGQNHELDLFNHRGAAIGVVDDIPTATTLTLTIASDINRFEKGMEVRMASTNGLTGSLSVGSATVTAVDRDTSTLTTDGSGWVAQIADAAAGFYIFPDGDFGVGRAGLADWCPDSTSGLGTAFYNATRSPDPSRLAGHRVSGANLSISQAVRNLCAKAGNNGKSFNKGYISVNQMNNLVTELDNKVSYIKEPSSPDAEVGWDAVKIIGGSSSIRFVASHGCPDDHIYLFDDQVLECIHSQNSPVEIEDMDGNVVSRLATDFGFDVRGQSFSNFRVVEPSKMGVIYGLAA